MGLNQTSFYLQITKTSVHWHFVPTDTEMPSVPQIAMSSNWPLNCNVAMWWPSVWMQTNSCPTTGLKQSEMWCANSMPVFLSLSLSSSAALCWCSDNTIRWGVFWETACAVFRFWNYVHALLCMFCMYLIHLCPVGTAYTYKCTEGSIWITAHSSVRSASVGSELVSCHNHRTSLPPCRSCRWMKKPRCGVPDQIGGASKFSVRKRRYALTGQRWQHKHITYRWVVF